jgi:hypothetical protein
MTIVAPTPAQSNSSIIYVAIHCRPVMRRIAERDPRFQRAVWMNSKCGGDTSFKTLHLFLKIKVMRPPAEPTAERRQLLRVRNFASPYEKAGVRQHVTLSAAINEPTITNAAI